MVFETYLKEIRSEGMDWIRLAQDRGLGDEPSVSMK
jgi:hypothetical protein